MCLGAVRDKPAQADITSFAEYPPGSEGRFSTVIDSTLLIDE